MQHLASSNIPDVGNLPRKIGNTLNQAQPAQPTLSILFMSVICVFVEYALFSFHLFFFIFIPCFYYI